MIQCLFKLSLEFVNFIARKETFRVNSKLIEMALQDSYKRVHDYLRISITDNCNFRCTYCMPDEDYTFLPSQQLMTTDEIYEIAETFVALGVKKIRITGGEPMVRKDFMDIMTRLSELPVELTLTTNGVLIDKHLDDLIAVGVRSINISLDTLNPIKFHQITKRNHFHKVLQNIQNCLKAGILTKINVVAVKGEIEAEIASFIHLTETYPLHVRFIEFMPFEGNHWDSQKVISATEMMEIALKEFDVVKLKDEKHETARKFQVKGSKGSFAFITTMSNHFCFECNRLRLTADGKIKNCLFDKNELDLLGALRLNLPITPIIEASLESKKPFLGGQFTNEFEKTDAEAIINRSMIKIGG